MIKDASDLFWNYAYNNNRKYYLKDLLLKLCDANLDKIIKSFNRPADMPNWKWLLITDPELIGKCTSKHFTIAENDKYCHLLTAQKPSRDYHCIKIT
jgi:transposase